MPCHGLQGCTLEYGPAWLAFFAVVFGCDAGNYAEFPLFALCGVMVYTVHIQINPKEKVTCLLHYPKVQADSILDHIPEYLLIVSIATLLPFPLSEAISKIQILHSKEYDQKDGIKLRS